MVAIVIAAPMASARRDRDQRRPRRDRAGRASPPCLRAPSARRSSGRRRWPPASSPATIAPSSGTSSAPRASSTPHLAHPPEAVGAGERRPREEPDPGIAPRRADRAGAGRGCRRGTRARSRRPSTACGVPARSRLMPALSMAPKPEASLHQDDVEPAIELPADRAHRADVLEAERAVHADRAGVGRVADHGQHLARAGGLASRDQLGEQKAAEAAARRSRRRGRPSPRGRSDSRGAAGTGSPRHSR